jgi:hypothetical protein
MAIPKNRESSGIRADYIVVGVFVALTRRFSRGALWSR